jgi:hypothetical protein
VSIPARFRACLQRKRESAVFLLPLLAALLLVAGALPLAAQSKPATEPASPAAAQSKPAAAAAPDNIETAGIRGKKLVLKDGSFQIVREYQVVGDRVRYYSIERSEWEEIPASLVDWDATRNAKDWPDKRAKKALALAHRVDLESRPGSLDVDAGSGLPPGVLLPPGEGMYALNGKTVQLLQAKLAVSKLNKGRFIAKMIVPVPVIPTSYTIYLDGKHAALRIPDPEPMFFYRTTSGTPQMRLIRTKEKGKRRQIEFLNNYFGEKKSDANEIPLNLQQISTNTYRLMAAQDLSPGEYVLAQLLPDRTIDLYVWDFAVIRAPKHASENKQN